MSYRRFERHVVVRGEIVELAQHCPCAGIDHGPLRLRSRECFDGVQRLPPADHQDLDPIALFGARTAEAEEARRSLRSCGSTDPFRCSR